MNRHIIYLHGFASGPGSKKAQYFARQFAGEGTAIEIPDLAEGNFEGLTLTGQLGVIERGAGGRRISLVGSSRRGYLAEWCAGHRRPKPGLELVGMPIDMRSAAAERARAITLGPTARTSRAGRLPAWSS